MDTKQLAKALWSLGTEFGMTRFVGHMNQLRSADKNYKMASAALDAANNSHLKNYDYSAYQSTRSNKSVAKKRLQKALVEARKSYQKMPRKDEKGDLLAPVWSYLYSPRSHIAKMALVEKTPQKP